MFISICHDFGINHQQPWSATIHNCLPWSPNYDQPFSAAYNNSGLIINHYEIPIRHIDTATTITTVHYKPAVGLVYSL